MSLQCFDCQVTISRKCLLIPLFTLSSVCCASSLARSNHYFARFLTVHGSHSMPLENPAMIPYSTSFAAKSYEYVLFFLLLFSLLILLHCIQKTALFPPGDFARVVAIDRGQPSKTYRMRKGGAYLGVISESHLYVFQFRPNPVSTHHTRLRPRPGLRPFCWTVWRARVEAVFDWKRVYYAGCKLFTRGSVNEGRRAICLAVCAAEQGSGDVHRVRKKKV